MPHDVFLSYHSKDKPAVERLGLLLRDAGINPWLDTWNLIPGDSWQSAIETALQECLACAIIVGPASIGSWQHEEMRAAIDKQVNERRFRVIPVLLPGAERGERSQLPRFLVANTWVEFRSGLDDKESLRRLICGVRGIPPGPTGSQSTAIACPYMGLKYFDVTYGAEFFGRDAETGWLIEALRSKIADRTPNRFIAIVGPSGSGKSSLARAGLFSALRRGELPGSETWAQVIFKPGGHPLESLGATGRGIFGIGSDPEKLDKFINECLASPRALHQKVRLILAEQPRESRVAILVDQFEEIFTLCSDASVREAFIQNLIYAVSVPDGQTIVILTIRADFLAHCAANETLANLISSHQELVDCNS